MRLISLIVLLSSLAFAQGQFSGGGGGSGSGTVSGTTGYITKFTSATAVGNSACDDGITTASTITCTEPIVVTAAGGGSVKLNGATSGTTTIQASAVAGTTTATLPAVTGTIVVPASSPNINQGLMSNGTTFDPVYVLFAPNSRRTALLIPSGSSSFTYIGEASNNTGTLSGFGTTSAIAQSVNFQQAAATINTNAGPASNANMYRTGRNLVFQTRLTPAESANVRYFIGFSDQTLGTMLGGDNVTGNYYGFAYCNDSAAGCTADQTTWQCVNDDNTANRTAANSGVTVSAGTEYTFEVWEDSSNSGRAYYKINGTLVCSSPVTSKVPAAGTNLGWAIGQQVLVAATQNNVRIASVMIQSDK